MLPPKPRCSAATCVPSAGASAASRLISWFPGQFHARVALTHARRRFRRVTPQRGIMSGCRAGRRFRRVTPQLGIIVPAGASASAARTDPRRMPLHARERMIAAYRQDHYRYPRSIPARYNPTLQTSCTHMSQRTMHAHYMRMAICEGQRPQRIQNRRKLSNHPGFSSTGKDTQQTPSDSFGRAPFRRVVTPPRLRE